MKNRGVNHQEWRGPWKHAAGSKDNQRIFRQRYASKFEDVYEMNIFLEKCNLTKTNSKRHLETLNSLINSKEIDSTIRNFPTNRTPVLDDFTGQFYQIFQDEITHYNMNSSGKQKKKCFIKLSMSMTQWTWQREGSMASYSPWDHKESYTTERLTQES